MFYKTSPKLSVIFLLVLTSFLILFTACPPPQETGNPGSDGKPPAGTEGPTPTTPAEYISEAGDVWLEPQELSINIGGAAISEVHINTGSQNLASYGIILSFNANVIDVDQSIITVVENSDTHAITYLANLQIGADGFIAAAAYRPQTADKAAELTISGFNVSGVGPGGDLHIVDIPWTGVSQGAETIGVTVDRLTDNTATFYPNTKGIDSTVTVSEAKVNL